jgi:uncharacterized protein DUF3306
MSDQENFLTRWSRRKRAADEAVGAATETPPAPVEQPPPNQSSELSGSEAGRPVETPATPEVDLSALPPIESITAKSDIRAFLAPGIPAQLTRAALRRAWASDPAIRDFVGLSENAWDFNAPDGVPGFGPLLPADDVKQMVADLLRERGTQSAGARATPDESAEKSEPSAAPEPPIVTADRGETRPSLPPEIQEAECHDLGAAVQKKAAAESRPAKVARGHGGALPQ